MFTCGKFLVFFASSFYFPELGFKGRNGSRQRYEMNIVPGNVYM